MGGRRWRASTVVLRAEYRERNRSEATAKIRVSS